MSFFEIYQQTDRHTATLIATHRILTAGLSKIRSVTVADAKENFTQHHRAYRLIVVVADLNFLVSDWLRTGVGRC